MPRAIMQKGEIVTELQDDEDWQVIGDRIVIAAPTDPGHSRELQVPDADVEGLVEVFGGGA